MPSTAVAVLPSPPATHPQTNRFTNPPPTPRSSTRHPRSVVDPPARRLAKLLCSLFLSLLFAAGLLLFFLFLILRPHRPRFHLTSLSLTASSVDFNTSIRNPNREIGIHYDSMSGSIYYMDDQIAAFDHLLSPFYQPPKNTTAVVGRAPVKAGETDADEIVSNEAKNGRVRLRLELRSTVRFRVTMWNTHRHNMHVTCNLEVGADGNLLPEFKDKRCAIYFL